MRTMYDSTNASAIPTTAQLVAGYVDGIYKWTSADWARFPNAVHVPIACFATSNAGTVLDIEAGCSTPWQAPHWVLMRRAAGVDPTVYVNQSNWATTRQAFQQQQLVEPHYWLATLDGTQPWGPGLVAIQYAGSRMSGGDFDLSAVVDYWPGVDRPGSTAGSEVIAQEVDLTQEHDWLALLVTVLAPGVDINDRATWPNYLGWSQSVTKGIVDLEAAVKAIPASSTNLQPVLDAVAALKTSLPTKVTGTLS